MSKLAHSNQETMDELDRRSAIENGDEDLIQAQTAKHTSGPWEFADTGNEGHMIVGDGKRIAKTVYAKRIDGKTEGFAESEANARLITAAPKLLESLKEIVKFYSGNFPQIVANQARAAIAEAEGR